MLYRISVAERGLTGIANIFRSRLSGLDDLLRAGTVPLTKNYRQKLTRETELFSLTCPGRSTVDLKRQTRTPFWIRNVPSYSLLLFTKLYHTQERDGAGGNTPQGAFSFGKKEGVGKV